MNVFNPTALQAGTRLPDPAGEPWQPRDREPTDKELLDRIALQSRRIASLEQLLACGDVVTLTPQLPNVRPRLSVTARAPTQTRPHWPEKPMPVRSLEPSPGSACFHLKGAGAKVIAFAVFGFTGIALEHEVARVADQQVRQGNFIPIFLTDSQDAGPFRRRGFVFEYFSPDTAPREPADLEFLQPRLDIIESKWGVDLFINLGSPQGSPVRREMRPLYERYLEAKSRFFAGRFASAQWMLADLVPDTLAQAQIIKIGKEPVYPLASIVVVSHRHHAGVISGLRSISRQIKFDRFEVILVDNGNGSLASLGRRCFRSCTIVNTGLNVGCSAARNIGAHIAKAPYIIFLDDDGITEDRSIEALVDCMEETGAIAARGRVVPLTSPELTGSHYDLGSTRRPALVTCEGISIWRRQPFIDAGGFDPLLAGHEGMALCSRLWRFHGPGGFIYEPQAVLLHDYAADESASQTKNRRYKRSTDYLDFLGLRWREINTTQSRFVADPLLGYLSLRGPRALPNACGLAASFVTTAKDARHFLAEYTASLMGQTDPEFEIIFIDDHSEDGTREEIERLWRGDPRLRVFENTGRGRGAALNAAMRHATGDICMIADADDLSVPQRLAMTRAFFADAPDAECLSFGAFSEKYPFRLGPPQSMFVDDLAVRQLFGMPVSFPTFAFRREKFCLPFDEELLGGIDCDWIYRNAAVNALKGRVIFYPAVYYREHAGQITSKRKDHQDRVRRGCIAASYRRILGELSDLDVQYITLLTETKQTTTAGKVSLTSWIADLLRKNRSAGIFDAKLLDQAMFEALREIRVEAPKK